MQRCNVDVGLCFCVLTDRTVEQSGSLSVSAENKVLHVQRSLYSLIVCVCIRVCACPSVSQMSGGPALHDPAGRQTHADKCLINYPYGTTVGTSTVWVCVGVFLGIGPFRFVLSESALKQSPSVSFPLTLLCPELTSCLTSEPRGDLQAAAMIPA